MDIDIRASLGPARDFRDICKVYIYKASVLHPSLVGGEAKLLRRFRVIELTIIDLINEKLTHS